MDLATAKERVVAAVDERAERLLDASRDLHEHPELCFEERHAHDLLVGLLADDGVAVEAHAFDVDTAFAGRAGGDGPTVAVLCEYDALPELGHACGHNVIAAAGLGAGLAAAAVADEAGGRVLVLGTPAEEGGGGKIVLADRGALDGVDAAMMLHPADADIDRMNAIAIQQIEARFKGLAAHAAAAPHHGRNALDAAVLAYNNVAALRQHTRPTERIHGIFTAAGDKPNIVPEYAAQHWYVRSDTLESVEALSQRVRACLEAGATAAGCEFEFEWSGPTYAEMIDNETMLGAYRANASTLGREVVDGRDITGVVGSTDMGNVSYQVPSIHPMIKLAPAGVPIHSAEFVRWARSDDADRAVLDGAKAMAMTVVDLWLRPELLDAAAAEFADTVPDVS